MSSSFDCGSTDRQIVRQSMHGLHVDAGQFRSRQLQGSVPGTNGFQRHLTATTTSRSRSLALNNFKQNNLSGPDYHREVEQKTNEWGFDEVALPQVVTRDLSYRRKHAESSFWRLQMDGHRCIRVSSDTLINIRTFGISYWNGWQRVSVSRCTAGAD